MGVMMVALTACENTAPADNAGTEAPQQTESAQESTQEAASDTSAKEASTQESTAQETAAEVSDGVQHPEYLVISDYYSNTYDGDYEKDADGNSLENKTIFEGKAQAVMVTESSKAKYSDLYNTVNSVAKSYLDAAKSNAEGYAQQAKEDLEASVEGQYPFYGPILRA